METKVAFNRGWNRAGWDEIYARRKDDCRVYGFEVVEDGVAVGDEMRPVDDLVGFLCRGEGFPLLGGRWGERLIKNMACRDKKGRGNDLELMIKLDSRVLTEGGGLRLALACIVEALPSGPIEPSQLQEVVREASTTAGQKHSFAAQAPMAKQAGDYQRAVGLWLYDWIERKVHQLPSTSDVSPPVPLWMYGQKGRPAPWPKLSEANDEIQTLVKESKTAPEGLREIVDRDYRSLQRLYKGTVRCVEAGRALHFE